MIVRGAEEIHRSRSGQTLGDCGHYVPEVTRTWETARIPVRDEDVRRERSWNDTSKHLTLVVNLDSSINEFECQAGDGARSIEPPTCGYMAIIPAGSLFSGTLKGQRNKYAIWTMQADTSC